MRAEPSALARARERGEDVPVGGVRVREGLWQDHGQTLVMVTHDSRVAAGAPRVLTMEDGHLADSANDWGREPLPVV